MRDPTYTEIMAELAVVEDQINAKNRRIARVLKKLKGHYWYYKGFKPMVEEDKPPFPEEWEILREVPARAHHCKTTEYGPIREYWADGRVQNFEGDSWSGSIYIQVKENRWVKVPYST